MTALETLRRNSLNSLPQAALRPVSTQPTGPSLQETSEDPQDHVTLSDDAQSYLHHVGAGLARPAGVQLASFGRADAREDDVETRQGAINRRQRAIQNVVDMRDPVARNRRITQDYNTMSHEMRDMLGPDAGANWSSWAAWASSRAGETIRQEDVPVSRGVRGFLGGVASGLLGPAGGMASDMANGRIDETSAQVGDGNRRVYQEIAPHLSRFIETFRGDQAPDERKFEQFARGFDGNQGDLRSAFRHYYDAMFEQDTKKKQELTLLGNSEIGLHEQRRLQPQINAALPGVGRSLAMRLMHLGLPGENLNLNQDVPQFQGRDFPPTLQHVDHPELQRFLSRWDRTPNTLHGSGAADWGNLPDRMNYIVDLFRSRALDNGLFDQTPH